MVSLPDYDKIKFRTFEKKDLHTVLVGVEDDALDLLEQFLQYSSPRRISPTKVSWNESEKKEFIWCIQYLKEK